MGCGPIFPRFEVQGRFLELGYNTNNNSGAAFGDYWMLVCLSRLIITSVKKSKPLCKVQIRIIAGLKNYSRFSCGG